MTGNIDLENEVDLKNYIDRESLKKIKHNIKKVFFFRVCGTGMGATASIFKEAKFVVEGCDIKFYPPMGDYLKKLEIPCHDESEINIEFLQKFDLIVVGNVLGKSSPEARMIERSNVPFTSFPAALGALILANQNVCGIAGTHGKTTTTYLATQVFAKLDQDPGYFIGGVLDDGNSAKLGSNKYFFIESDEYDSSYFEKFSKFRSYELKHMILTSLEFDHADIFVNLEAIKDEFRSVLPNLEKNFIYSTDYPAAVELKNLVHPSRVFSYGKKNEHGPYEIATKNGKTSFKLKFNNQELTFVTNVFGVHNVLNLSSIIVFALIEKFPKEKIDNAILDLKMVKRRQEERGCINKLLVLDDFAHHPTAVEETILAVKSKYPNKLVHAILEPNSATARSAIFEDEFANSLLLADSVLIAKPLKSTTVKGQKDLGVTKIKETVVANNIKADVAVDLLQVKQWINDLAQTNKEEVLLIMSNGTCLGLWEDQGFLKCLK